MVNLNNISVRGCERVKNQKVTLLFITHSTKKSCQSGK
uniref:Uncharacterized protein n=1 Tax=Lepeophtheirus salmonis TaxID=72036 RepID=A0A0K2V6V9_LEPSM